MKSKTIATALFALTAATVALYPLHQGNATPSPQRQDSNSVVPTPNQSAARVEVVFVLDTTSSMSGLIEAAKEKIWSIATTLASAQQAPKISMGLIAFRDRGDTFVTRVSDLSEDLDSMYATLMDFHAEGGGDTPESVNQALYDAIHNISWSQDPGTYRVVFLVGDSPPHMDYQDEVQYPVTLENAGRKGIVVNAIQSGPNHRTTLKWRQIARLGNGNYFKVDQAGSTVAIETPFDHKLADISRKLDDTRLYYGSKQDKEKQRRKVEATNKLHSSSSITSRARRATFNASKSGRTNLLGKGELIDDVSSGRVDLSAMDRDELPASLQDMSPDEQKTIVDETAGRRKKLEHEIIELTEQRSAYIKQKVEEQGGAVDSLDEKIYSAVREQAARLGLEYEAESSAY